jgi:hypothetical protein
VHALALSRRFSGMFYVAAICRKSPRINCIVQPTSQPRALQAGCLHDKDDRQRKMEFTTAISTM